MSRPQSEHQSGLGRGLAEIVMLLMMDALKKFSFFVAVGGLLDKDSYVCMHKHALLNRKALSFRRAIR